jgi:hypothetical protein
VTDRVAIVDSGDPVSRAIADEIATALAAFVVAPPSAPAPAPEGPPATSPPAFAVGRDAIGADIVVAIDPAALAASLASTARTRIAYLAWLDPAWEQCLARADHVLVAHPSMLEGAVSLGAARATIRAGAFVAPPSSTPPRAALRAELSLAAAVPLVIVPRSSLLDDPSGVLLQLSLARAPTHFLFDVGRDVALAEMLRQRALFEAHMFAEGTLAERAWGAADRALVSPGSPDLALALARHLPPIFGAPSAGTATFVRALAELGVASAAASEATLAIAIDHACARASIDRARAALATLDPRSGASRVAVAITRALTDTRAAAHHGLPHGLEPIGPPRSTSTPATRRDGGGGEDEIERELAALRAKLARE